MKDSSASQNQQAGSEGRRHKVKFQYTNKDAQQLLFEFLRRQGPDVNAHEVAVDFFAEHQDFSEGFKTYSIIHVLEDILKHMLSRPRTEESTQMKLPGVITEHGGLPQYIPYLSDSGQERRMRASDARWFHIESWRNAEARGFKRRTKRHRDIQAITAFLEPHMKGTELTVSAVCEQLAKKQKPN